MPFIVSIDQAKIDYPNFTFVRSLTPSEQKAAFHVRDQDGNDLCLKIISPDYDMDRLQREIVALQTLAHPNIASLKQYVFSSTPSVQRHYLVEEFIVGDDLALSLPLVGGTPWPRSEVATFFAALCDGLAQLRRVNIVHRDLKPTNIRRRPNGLPVIIDFGLARHLDLPDITNTHEGAAIGTPAYFAPEQFLGTKHDIDHRTDLFAVGILLYQALMGRHPFIGAAPTRNQIRDAICTSQDHLATAAFRSLPSQWQVVVTKLLEKERGRRLQSADQVATILNRIGGI